MTDIWMQLLVATAVAGVAVSKTTHVVLARVGTRHASNAPHKWAPVGSSISQNSDAVEGLALLVGLDSSRINVMYTKDSEVHCSIQADPDKLLELAEMAEAAIDQAFRERHHWTDLRVYLHLEA